MKILIYLYLTSSCIQSLIRVPIRNVAARNFVLVRLFSGSESKSHLINQNIKKEAEKVVDTINIKDGKVVLCRCWKSNKFPYCDGAHNAYNKANGDNVGPCIVQVTTNEA